MIVFPPLENYEEEEKIESYKSFYREYILDREIDKKDVKELGLLIEDAANFLLTNPQRLYDANESINWNAINTKIKKISPKLYSEVYSKIVSNNSPAIEYIDNNDGFWRTVGKLMVNSDLTKLNNAETRIPFLQVLHSCLEVGGLDESYKKREQYSHKKYNVRISPTGILNEYAFFLNENALKEIIFAHKRDKTILFNGKKFFYDKRREVEITSTLLKEDEVPLFLEKEGVFLMKKKKWRVYHSEDFFRRCEKEPNLIYDYPDFHPKKELTNKSDNRKNLKYMSKKRDLSKTVGNISAETINITNSNFIAGDSANMTINNSTNDKKLVEGLKELLELFKKIEKDTLKDIDYEELEGEMVRLEKQSKKDSPRKIIITQSLTVVKDMLTNIASNAWTEPFLEKIKVISGYL